MRDIIGHSRPTIAEDDIRAVRRVLKSGWIAQGDEVRGLEEELARAVGVADGVCVNSGTAALHLALVAAGVGKGDRVVIPGYCCSAVLRAVKLVGGLPVPVDVDPSKLVVDTKDLVKKTAAGATAVIFVHLLGYPGPVQAAVDTGVPVIEDCAQSIGATVNGEPVGSFGTLSVFSFYATKLITTGEGGMVLSDDVDILSKVGKLRSSRTSGNGAAFSYTMSDIQAALGRSQLSKLVFFLKKRKKLVDIYRSELDGLPLDYIEEEDGKIPVYYRFVVRLRGIDVQSVIDSMEDAGVQCRRPFEEPLFKLTDDGDLPGCRKAFDELLSIPIYPSLGEEDVVHIAREMKRVVRRSDG